MEEALRREVRFLTTRLGAIIEEQCGPETFAAIEKLRTLAKQIRRRHDIRRLRAKEREVARLSPERATQVAHAFSLFFHLVNLCEERVRRLRAYERQDLGAPMSLRHTFSELRRHRVPASALNALLASMRIEPVLTAHPTEAKRRSVLNHILRIDIKKAKELTRLYSSREKLATVGKADRAFEINETATRIAKEVAGDNVLVAGDLSATWKWQPDNPSARSLWHVRLSRPARINPAHTL